MANSGFYAHPPPLDYEQDQGCGGYRCQQKKEDFEFLCFDGKMNRQNNKFCDQYA